MTTTIKDAADDAGFIMALMALQGFNDKVYIKATPADEVYTKNANYGLGDKESIRNRRFFMF